MNFIREVISLYVERFPWFMELLGEHLGIVFIAAGIAAVLGLIIGIVISEHQRSAPVILSICNILYTIPSISLLGILIPFLGIGNLTAITALIVYGMMPMVRNTFTGLTNIDPQIIEAAVAMGSTKKQLLFRIKLPLAFSVILTGLRSMIVMTISVGAIASFIGAGGLGVAVYRGISIYDPAMTFAGSLLIAALALIVDLLLGILEKTIIRKAHLKS